MLARDHRDTPSSSSFCWSVFIENKLGQRASQVVNVNTRMEWGRHGGQSGHSDVREVGEESMNNEMVSGAEEAMKQKALSLHCILPEARGHHTAPASLGKVGLEPGKEARSQATDLRVNRRNAK